MDEEGPWVRVKTSSVVNGRLRWVFGVGGGGVSLEPPNPNPIPIAFPKPPVPPVFICKDGRVSRRETGFCVVIDFFVFCLVDDDILLSSFGVIDEPKLFKSSPNPISPSSLSLQPEIASSPTRGEIEIIDPPLYGQRCSTVMREFSDACI